jgi:adenylosuccinate synthase
LRYRLSQHARNHITSTACGIGNNDPDRFAREALRDRRLGDHRERNNEYAETDKFVDHFTPRSGFSPD